MSDSGFIVKAIKFVGNRSGVEVVRGRAEKIGDVQHVRSFTYGSIAERDKMIEEAKRDILKEIGREKKSDVVKVLENE